MNKEKLMLYFHIPFCVSKCAYCAFYSTPKWDGEFLDAYTNALIAQIDSFEEKEKYLVSSVYFGGGTPTVLGAEKLCRILERVKNSFELENGAEITAEANPDTASFKALAEMKAAGFNRLSIGVQSFNDQTLKLLNRPHNAEDAMECIKSARRVGFDNISADLIFALPNESLEMLSNSVTWLTNLRPEHISVYGLTLEEGTPLCAAKDKYSFPTEELEEEQHEALCKLLGDSGYIHYEISNFSLPGYEAKHNTGYWQRTPYFGFGAGAHSFFKGCRFDTANDIKRYIEKGKDGFLAPTGYADATPVSAEEAEEERIMLGLRLNAGVELPPHRVPSVIIDKGLGVYKDGRLALTEKGFRVSNTLIGMILE